MQHGLNNLIAHGHVYPAVFKQDEDNSDKQIYSTYYTKTRIGIADECRQKKTQPYTQNKHSEEQEKSDKRAANHLRSSVRRLLNEFQLTQLKAGADVCFHIIDH